ncbi:hypothetical protein NIES22_00890 [Calothrix brevissima NIES-22]|nr:hypothetical protein NIES22_00890 [Calothrix brevissima NIES-22]
MNTGDWVLFIAIRYDDVLNIYLMNRQDAKYAKRKEASIKCKFTENWYYNKRNIYIVILLSLPKYYENFNRRGRREHRGMRVMRVLWCNLHFKDFGFQ